MISSVSSKPGRVDPAVAVERADRLHLRPRPLPLRLLGRKDVVGAARRFERHRAARSSVRNGFDASSSPRVVGRPWPGVDGRLGREALGEQADRVEERRPVAAGQVDAADRAGEEHVAREERAVGGEGEVARRVAGDRERLPRDAGQLERLVAGEPVLGLPRADVHAVGGVDLVRPLEHERLGLGDPDRRAGALRQAGDAAEVVEVRVRDEDPRAVGRRGGRAPPRTSAASSPGSITTASGAGSEARTA